MKDFLKIKLLVCDCDGVLTDGSIIYESNDVEIKAFSAHDGIGFQILRHSDIIPVVITGRSSRALELRCKDYFIHHLYQGVRNKKMVLEKLISELNLSYDNVAYIGDDWNDFLAMEQCQLKIAPKNANATFKMTVDYVTEKNGGNGAVRDAIEYLLKKRNEFEKVLNSFLEELGKSDV